MNKHLHIFVFVVVVAYYISEDSSKVLLVLITSLKIVQRYLYGQNFLQCSAGQQPWLSLLWPPWVT
jgi:hypothetical protein